MENIVQYIKDKNERAIDIILGLSIAMLNSEYDSHMTLLSHAVKSGNFEIVNLLLTLGANPNGITSEGYTNDSPISYASEIQDFLEMKEIISKLLEYGADVNLSSVSGKTLLYNLLNKTIADSFLDDNDIMYEYYQKVEYVLARGANPNGSKEHPLMLMLFNEYLLFQKKIYVDLLLLLLYFGANIEYKNKDGISLFSKMRTINSENEDINNLCGLLYDPYSAVIENCEENILLKRLVKAFKIPLKNRNIYEENRKKAVCKCLEMIIKNYSTIDFEDIKQRRSKKFKYNKYANNTTFDGVDLSEFMTDELIILPEGKLYWAFHVSEIPLLLKSRKNPYTTSVLPNKFILDILDVDVFPQITLENAYDETISQKLLDFETPEMEIAQRLENIVHSYNVYVDTDFNKYNLVFLKYILYLIEPYLHINIPAELLYKPIGMSDEDWIKQLRHTVPKYLIRLLNTHILNIPRLTFILEQANNDLRLVNEIKDILRNYDDLKPFFIHTTIANIRLMYPDLITQEEYTELRNKLSENGVPENETWGTIKYLLGDNFIRPPNF